MSVQTTDTPLLGPHPPLPCPHSFPDVLLQTQTNAEHPFPCPSHWAELEAGSPRFTTCIHSLTPYQQHLLVSFLLTGPSRSWGRSQSGTAESHCTQAERERYMCVRVRKYVRGGGRICVYLCICVYLSVCLSARRLLQCYSVARTLDEYNRSKPQG